MRGVRFPPLTAQVLPVDDQTGAHVRGVCTGTIVRSQLLGLASAWPLFCLLLVATSQLDCSRAPAMIGFKP